MYLWKCWRDTRGAFLTFLGALLLTALWHRAIAADWLGWASSNTWGMPRAIWEQTAEAVLGMLLPLVPLSGFVIGALGVGSEFSSQTIPFLLTRPRQRRFFLWSSWLAGATEVCLLVLIAAMLLGTRTAVSSSPDRITSAAGIIRAASMISVPALVIFSATFFFTVLLRKEQHGTNAAVAAIFSYSGVVALARLLYDVRIPVFWELYGGAFRTGSPLPLAAITGWLGFALFMTFAAYFVFERAET